MPEPYNELYVHLVWATWDRAPLITPEIEPALYRAIAAKCRELRCVPLAIGGDVDHVHVLVEMHAAVSVALLAKEVKGGSSHLVTHVLKPGGFFRWQGAYSAFTLRKDDVPTVERYIQRQKEHHRSGIVEESWERPMLVVRVGDRKGD